MIDWLRVVGHGVEHGMGCALWESFFSSAREYPNSRIVPWAGFGFRGQSLVDDENRRVITWATGRDGQQLIETSSAHADSNAMRQLFTRLSQSPDMYLTRIDYAIDFGLDTPVNLARDWFIRLRDDGIRYVKYVETNGSTLYVNHRSGVTYYRLYDKGAQANLDVSQGTLWRAEVELKGNRARKTGIMQSGHTTFVRAEFERVGISLPIDDDGHTTPMPAIKPPNTLGWLQRTVAPCVRRLVEETDTELDLILGIITSELKGDEHEKG